MQLLPILHAPLALEICRITSSSLDIKFPRREYRPACYRRGGRLVKAIRVAGGIQQFDIPASSKPSERWKCRISDATCPSLQLYKLALDRDCAGSFRTCRPSIPPSSEQNRIRNSFRSNFNVFCLPSYGQSRCFCSSPSPGKSKERAGSGNLIRSRKEQRSSENIPARYRIGATIRKKKRRAMARRFLLFNAECYGR